MEFATKINFGFLFILTVFLIWVGGVKAWCSAAVIFAIAICYYGYIQKFNLLLTDNEKPYTIAGLFAGCYLIVIALCVGFSQIKPATITKSQTAKNASINALFLMGLTFAIITILPFLVHLFGNTFGYWIVSSFNKEEINRIVRGGINTYDAIKQNTDYNFLITLEPATILEIIRRINNTKDVSIDLSSFIQRKTAIGHFVWVSLASIATVITTLSGRTFYS